MSGKDYKFKSGKDQLAPRLLSLKTKGDLGPKIGSKN